MTQPTADELDAARVQGLKTVIDLRLPQKTSTAPFHHQVPFQG